MHIFEPGEKKFWYFIMLLIVCVFTEICTIVFTYVQCGNASLNSFKGTTEISYIKTP